MLKHLLAPITAALAILLSTAVVQAAEKTIPGPGGLTLTANLTLADGQSLGDGVVLLQHGTLAHNGMEIIVALQELLAERGISSLAPTLSLGLNKRSGMYDCATPHTHRHEDAMTEMGLWLDWLEGEGATAITVVGHSRGGNQVAWLGAEFDRPSVRGYALLAPGTWNAERAAAGFKKNHKADLNPLLVSARAMVAAGQGASMMKGIGVLYCPGADVSAASFVSYYQDDPRRHTPHLIDKIKKPVLLVTGSEDTVVADIDAAAEAMADGERVFFTRIEGAGHFFRDLYGEDVADAIQEFIER